MEFTEEQKAKVREWIGAGLKLSEIQDQLGKEFSLHLLYMDVRLLVDDLQLTPKETVEEAPKPAVAPAGEGDFGTLTDVDVSTCAAGGRQPLVEVGEVGLAGALRDEARA